MAAKLPVIGGKTDTASVMSFGFDPYISEKSPYHGAYCAVVESVARLVAAGVPWRRARLSFQEYFRRMGPDAESWGIPFSALLGAYRAQIGLGVAAIGGKDSMSGTFEGEGMPRMDVPPTLISFAIAPYRASKLCHGRVQAPGSRRLPARAGAWPVTCCRPNSRLPRFSMRRSSCLDGRRRQHICGGLRRHCGGCRQILLWQYDWLPVRRAHGRRRSHAQASRRASCRDRQRPRQGSAARSHHRRKIHILQRGANPTRPAGKRMERAAGARVSTKPKCEPELAAQKPPLT